MAYNEIYTFVSAFCSLKIPSSSMSSVCSASSSRPLCSFDDANLTCWLPCNEALHRHATSPEHIWAQVAHEVTFGISQRKSRVPKTYKKVSLENDVAKIIRSVPVSPNAMLLLYPDTPERTRMSHVFTQSRSSSPGPLTSGPTLPAPCHPS